MGCFWIWSNVNFDHACDPDCNDKEPRCTPKVTRMSSKVATRITRADRCWLLDLTHVPTRSQILRVHCCAPRFGRFRRGGTNFKYFKTIRTRNQVQIQGMRRFELLNWCGVVRRFKRLLCHRVVSNIDVCLSCAQNRFWARVLNPLKLTKALR